GALTIGTRDGATIEMAREAGEENFFLFGLSADEVEALRRSYDPRRIYVEQEDVRRAIDLILGDHFSRYESGAFRPIIERLLDSGDPYVHLAALRSYAEAQGRVSDVYAAPEAWAARSIRNVAASGRFSSDRTIREYASQIWNTTPCPVA